MKKGYYIYFEGRSSEDISKKVDMQGTGKVDPKRITMLGVAYMQRQHEYERMIEGLKNMSEVVEFYRSFSKKDKNENAKVIHQYAKEHADMAVVMKPIVEYIK